MKVNTSIIRGMSPCNSWILLLLVTAMAASATASTVPRIQDQTTRLLRGSAASEEQSVYIDDDGRHGRTRRRRQSEMITVSREPDSSPAKVEDDESKMITVSREPDESATNAENDETPSTRQDSDGNGDGEHLIIGVNFAVSSTSHALSDHRANIGYLESTLRLFATTLINEWDYRRELLLQGDNLLGALPSSTIAGGSESNSSTSGALNTRHRRRRLEITLLPDSVEVNDHLVASQDCKVSVTQEGSPTCHKAHGRFQILASPDENNARVCRNMATSVEKLMDEGYLQDALDMSVQSDMVLSPGAMEFCQPLDDYVAPTTPQPEPARNVFNHSGSPTTAPAPTPTADDATTPDNPTAATPAPTTPRTPPPGTDAPTVLAPTVTQGPTGSPALSPKTTAPIPPVTEITSPPTAEEFVDEWVQLLEDAKEEQQQLEEEEGNEWLNTLEEAQATGDEESDEVQDVAPAPSSAKRNHNYTEEMALLREEYWDDSVLDRIITILLMTLGICGITVCCCYIGDAAWIRYRQEQLYAENGEYYHDGRWYWDENHKFPKPECRGKKPPKGEMDPLAEGEEESSEYDEEEDNSMYMSDSESDEYSDFEGDHSFTDGTGVEESGDFYVDYDEEDDEEDIFDEDSEFEDDDDGHKEESDFFDDEAQSEQFKPKPKAKAKSKPKKKKG